MQPRLGGVFCCVLAPKAAFLLNMEAGPLKIKDLAEADRPRERLLAQGPAALSNAELLGILVNTGLPRLTAVDIAKQLLAAADNSLDTLGRKAVADLQKHKGIGQAKAITIAAALELGRRRAHEQGRQQIPFSIADSQSVYAHFRHLFHELDYESFQVAFLNRRLAVISSSELSRGGITGTVVDVRMLFRQALESKATALILMHNHPSGNTNPSRQDEELTRKVKQAAELFDIQLVDHLIFTDKSFFSFRDQGKL